MLKTVAQNVVSRLKASENRYLLIGLFLFYLIQLVAPNKPVYFLSYFIAIFFFYLSRKNMRESLLFGLILSVFSEVGLAGSLFLMDPKDLDLGSGWWVSPMTVILVTLVPLSLFYRFRKFQRIDGAVFLFFLWNSLIFVLLPSSNSLFGLFTLSEQVLMYFLLRTSITKQNISTIVFLLLSMIVFQNTLAVSQFTMRHPIGSRTETVLVDNPYGLTAPEEENIFRSTGSYGHPNLLAAFFLGLTPLLFVYSAFPIPLIFLVIISFLSLFFTFSRTAWVLSVPLLILFGKKYLLTITNFPKKILKGMAMFFIPLCLLAFFLFPLFRIRLGTVQDAFVQQGSFVTREKLIEEALRIVGLYPITGIGIQQSVPFYSQDSATNLFSFIQPSGFYRIHNTPLEIAAETGLPGMFLFLAIIFLSLYQGLYKRKSSLSHYASFGLILLFGISLFNPFFHASVFRIFFLLVAIILT